MQIYKKTGSESTDWLRVNKGFSSILFLTSDLSLDNLEDATISVYIEKITGDNIEIFNAEPILDVLQIQTTGDSAVTLGKFSDGSPLLAANIPLSEGNLLLEDGETIRIKLDGLQTSKKYQLNTIELPEYHAFCYKIDSKIILSDEKEKVINIDDSDLMLIRNYGVIREAIFHYDNGSVCRYTPQELLIMSLDIDLIASLNFNDTGKALIDTTLNSHNLILATDGIERIEIKKISGVVELKMQSEQEYI